MNRQEMAITMKWPSEVREQQWAELLFTCCFCLFINAGFFTLHLMLSVTSQVMLCHRPDGLPLPYERSCRPSN